MAFLAPEDVTNATVCVFNKEPLRGGKKVYSSVYLGALLELAEKLCCALYVEFYNYPNSRISPIQECTT